MTASSGASASQKWQGDARKMRLPFHRTRRPPPAHRTKVRALLMTLIFLTPTHRTVPPPQRRHQGRSCTLTQLTIKATVSAPLCQPHLIPPQFLLTTHLELTNSFKLRALTSTHLPNNNRTLRS